jgi:hypothetical protein
MTAKLQEVTQLLSTLKKDLQEKHLTSARESQGQSFDRYVILTFEFHYPEKVQTLLQLRQHGTNPVDAGPIYCNDVR